jgi:hypothetical protein
MKINKFHFLLILLLLAILISCKEIYLPFLNLDEIDKNNYPTILIQKTPEEFDLLNKEFHQLNNNKINTNLNRFGLTGETGNLASHQNPRIKVSEKQALIFAVTALINNSKFTNVTDSLELLSRRYHIQYLQIDSSKCIVYFSPQQYHEYEIINTLIRVGVFGDGIYFIDGTWYKDIYIPFNDKFDIDLSVDKIIGKSITWDSEFGPPNELIIVRELISQPITKVIFTLVKENLIEIRFVWKIPIMHGKSVGWHLYFDTTFGEVVAIIQEFV